MKNLLKVGSAVALVFAAPLLAFAAYMHAGDNVSVDASQNLTDTNVYVAGGNVSVSAPVGGDVLAGGGTVNISTRIDGDVMAGGGTIVFVGSSAEDVRIAGGNVTVGGEVRGELVAVGGSVTVLSGTTVAKEAHLAGGNVVFQGTVTKDLVFVGGTMRIDGTVSGNVLVRGAQKLTLGPRARIAGDLEYSAPEAVVLETGATVGGETVFHQVERNARAGGKAGAGFLFGLITFWWLAKTAILLAAAYLIWYFRREDAVHVLTRGTSHFGRELFVGFAIAVLTPVLAILLCVTILGIIPGVVLALAYAILIILAKPIAVLLVASLITRHTNLAWYHILLGMLVLDIAILIPFIGWIAGFVVCLVALGSLGEVLKPRFERRV